MITFNWTISAVDRTLSLDGLTNVIKTVHWRYRATDENGVSTETYGATSLGEPNPNEFTPFNEVNESDVIIWLEDMLNIIPDVEIIEGEEVTEVKISQLQQMKESLEAKIELIKQPKTITGPLYSVTEIA
tara:strand:- start:1203 stop:1592 length:390 start_codon:yes stop_codon:yes gene_type:complete